MTNPQIRINFAWLLYENESTLLHKHYAKKGEKLVSAKIAADKVLEYRFVWSEYESRIIPAMQQILGVEFYKSVIDVSIAPWFISQSDPLIINPGYDPDEFVDILTHELFHVLLTDNNVVRLRDGTDNGVLLQKWQALFGKKHSFGTIVHIPVHAGLKYIYLDVLKNKVRLDRDMKTSKNYGPDYVKSWGYVEANDYMRIISDVANIYK